jgi:hypothetical protein
MLGAMQLAMRFGAAIDTSHCDHEHWPAAASSRHVHHAYSRPSRQMCRMSRHGESLMTDGDAKARGFTRLIPADSVFLLNVNFTGLESTILDTLPD